MRLLLALLLLLLLPGLLLPAEFVLSLCRCATAADARDAPNGAPCCAVAATHCCAAATGDADGGAGGEAARERHDCKCPVLRTPEHRDEATAPGRADATGQGPLAIDRGPLVRQPVVASVRPRGGVGLDRPPPPDHARNLPLRL